jgi:nitroreductase
MSWLRKDTVDERLELILGRRSIRLYAPGEVQDEQVRKLLMAAMAAPSAAAKNPWHFVVVKSRQTLSRIAMVLPNGQMLETAALGVAVCGDLQKVHDEQISYLLLDCAAAIENMLLCAHILGLGTCWLAVYPREDRIKKLRETLSLPASIIPVSFISIGLPGESKEAHTQYYPDRVHAEVW